MADISVINVGGSDYNVKDATGRSNANKALTLLAYQETGNTASQAYSIIGTPINWKGTLYYTKTAVAKGATWAVGTNLTAATNLGKLTSNIKTYVNGSGQLVFRDLTGADTVLPFSGTWKELGVKRANWGSIFANGNYETPSVPYKEYPVGTYIKLVNPSDYPGYGDWYALQPGTYYCLEEQGTGHRKVVLTSANTFPYNLRISSVNEAQVFVY